MTGADADQTARREEHAMISWPDHAVWWHIYPLGFTGALHAGPGHRLGRIIGWLDYAVELGASGLQLGPIFASETHGYDTTDHFTIDPRPAGGGPPIDLEVLAAAEVRSAWRAASPHGPGRRRRRVPGPGGHRQRLSDQEAKVRPGRSEAQRAGGPPAASHCSKPAGVIGGAR